jgi:hypothetical protein
MLFLLILAVFLISTCKKELGIERVNIPDQAFLQALIDEGVDTDGDANISSEEAEAITYLDVSGTGDLPGSIVNMTGIEAFINLDTLICGYN